MKFKVQYDLNLNPLERLKAYGIRKAIRIGANRATARVKSAVVGHANRVRRYGFLANAIRIRVKVYTGEKYVSVVGPSSKVTRKKGVYVRGKKKGEPRVSKPSRYAHLLEGGTKRSRAKPFLKPAYYASAGRFLADVKREVAKEIELELARQRAK